MVDPSERMRKLQLLKILETSKVFCHMGEDCDVGSSDVSSNQEHPGGHVIVYKIDKLLGRESGDHLDKLADHHPFGGVFSGKEYVFKVASSRDF